MWIARDKDGSLFLYDTKPIRSWEYFYSRRGFDIGIELNPYTFIEVTFENSPMEVELRIKKQYGIKETTESPAHQ